MKSLIVLTLCLISLVSMAQKEVSDTLDFNRFKEDGYYSSYKNNHLFNAMKLTDGSYVKVGDEIIIGKPSGTTTILQANPGLFSGSTNTVSAFSLLTIGRMGLSVMAGMQYLPSTWSNTKVLIKEIKKGWTIFELKGVNGGNIIGTIIAFAGAIDNGEIINPNASMTREQAIVKLKEAKDLVELGMMTKEDFEKLKIELTPLIIKKIN